MQAVRGVSFSLAGGEIVAMIGPNGAGKTTCFNILGGQIAPDSGAVRFAQRPLAGLAAHEIARLGVGRTFQIPATFASMSVRENVQVALLSAAGRSRSLRGLAARFGVAEADALLRRVEMQALAERPCAALAYGDVKRMELAIALAGRPRLLLMDEPTAGMAAKERAALMRLVTTLAAQDGTAVLFTEHDMSAVFDFAQRVLVLHEGALVANASPQAVRADPFVREIYLGEA